MERAPVMAPAPLGVLIRWRSRIGWRALRAYTFRTLEGRVMLVLLALALPSIRNLLAGGPFGAGPHLDGKARVGALVVSHLVLAGCYGLMVPVYLLKVFVLEGARDPLHAHPWVLPEVRVLTVAGAIAWPALYLWAFYYLFFGRLVVGGGSSLVLAVHFAAGILWLVPLGVTVAGGAARILAYLDLARRARLLQRAAIVPFLLVFAAVPVLPLVLRARAPDLLARVGTLAPGFLHFGQVPVALVVALEERRWLAALAWSAALGSLGTWAGRSLWGWRRNALRDLPLDLQPATGAVHSCAFGRGLVPGGRGRLLRDFWLKDVVLPARRTPSAWLRTVLPSVATVGGTGGAAWALGRDGVPPATLELLVRAGLLLAVAWAGAGHALASLGREAHALALLRPRLTWGRLFLLKLAANVAHLALLAFGLAVLLAAGLRVVGVPSAGGRLLLEAALWAVPVAVLGTAVGFALPGRSGPRGRPSAGGSPLARVLFPPLAALPGAGAALLLSAGGSEAAAPASAAAILAVGTAVVFGFAAVLAAVAVRRLEGRDW